MASQTRAHRWASVRAWWSRRSVRSLALATLVAGSCDPVAAATATYWDKDALLVLLKEHAADGTLHDYVNESTDASFSRWLIGGFETPYSELAGVALSPPDDATRRAIALASSTHGPVTQRMLHDWKVWDLGYTKVDAMRRAPVPEELRAGAWGVPHIMKAGIDPDLYKAGMRGLLDINHPAIQANYVLALQVLREKLTEVNQRFWRERGLRGDVIGRFTDPERHGEPTDFDLHYLVQLLDGELSTWRGAGTNRYGFRELPANLRLARLAAAYREGMPYSSQPCASDRRYMATHAGMGGNDGRPLCFDDATDRAVYHWYTHELRDDLGVLLVNPGARTTTLLRLTGPLYTSNQGRLGIPDPFRRMLSDSLEMVQIKVANRLLAHGELSAAQGDTVARTLSEHWCGGRL